MGSTKEIKPWYLEIYIGSEGCLLWGSQLSSSKEWELGTTCVASREISFSYVIGFGFYSSAMGSHWWVGRQGRRFMFKTIDLAVMGRMNYRRVRL